MGLTSRPGFDYDAHGGWPGMDDYAGMVGVSTVQASRGSDYAGGRAMSRSVKSFSSEL